MGVSGRGQETGRGKGGLWLKVTGEGLRDSGGGVLKISGLGVFSMATLHGTLSLSPPTMESLRSL